MFRHPSRKSLILPRKSFIFFPNISVTSPFSIPIMVGNHDCGNHSFYLGNHDCGNHNFYLGNHDWKSFIFGWKSVMILFFLYLLFNLNMFGSSCVWQNGCIGRESNPGRPRSAFYSLAGEHSTTEPPMLVVNDVVILVVITSEWAVVVRKGKSQWMKIMVEWIKNVPPMRGIEPRPRRWKRRILTTRPHGTVVGKSQSKRPADKILGRRFFF